MLVTRFGWRRTLIFVAMCELLIKCVESLFIMRTGTDDLNQMWSLSRVTYLLDASPLAYWFSWSLGAWIADAFLNGRPLPLAKSSLAFWSALVVGSYCVKPLVPFFFTLVAILTATAISKLLIQKITIRIPSFFLSHLRLTGIWSYSIYLLHQPLIVMGLGALLVICPPAKDEALVQFGFCLVMWFVIMLIGGLWHRICELPSIACGKRFAANAKVPQQCDENNCQPNLIAACPRKFRTPGLNPNLMWPRVKCAHESNSCRRRIRRLPQRRNRRPADHVMVHGLIPQLCPHLPQRCRQELRHCRDTWSNGRNNQSRPAYSGVQEILSSSNWIYVRSTGLGSHIMGPWQNGWFPNLPIDQHFIYAFPRHPQPQTGHRFNHLGEIGLTVDGVRIFDSGDALLLLA